MPRIDATRGTFASAHLLIDFSAIVLNMKYVTPSQSCSLLGLVQSSTPICGIGRASNHEAHKAHDCKMTVALLNWPTFGARASLEIECHSLQLESQM